MFTQQSIIGVVGSGAMGLGIGQISATQHHKTIIFDSSIEAIEKAKNKKFQKSMLMKLNQTFYLPILLMI